MKKYLIKIVIFVVVLIALDRGTFYFLQTQRPSDYKLFLDSKKAFFKKQYEVDCLIIGDSHIADAMDVRTLEKQCRIKGYNLGVYHSTPFEYYYLTKAAISHLDKKPSTVIIGTNPVMFEKPLSKGKYTPIILGYNRGLIFNSKEGIDHNTISKTYQERYLFKHVYKKIMGHTYIPTRKVVSVYKGHLEFYNQIKSTEWKTFRSDVRGRGFKKAQVDYFYKTIDFLLKQGIKVVIVNSPIWWLQLGVIEKTRSFSKFTQILQETKNKFKIEIFNPNHHLLKHELGQSDFLNTQHLNYKGSKKFTKAFCNYFCKSK